MFKRFARIKLQTNERVIDKKPVSVSERRKATQHLLTERSVSTEVGLDKSGRLAKVKNN